MATTTVRKVRPWFAVEVRDTFGWRLADYEWFTSPETARLHLDLNFSGETRPLRVEVHTTPRVHA